MFNSQDWPSRKVWPVALVALRKELRNGGAMVAVRKHPGANVPGVF